MENTFWNLKRNINLFNGKFELFVLVCFDIVEDRNRRRAVKIIEEYGNRVQKSVFECNKISEEQFLKMKNRLEDCIDTMWDTVRFYRICMDCINKMEFTGIGTPPFILSYKVV